MSEKNVTLQDIASRAGVSLMTVSRALNGTGRMSESVRKRINELAQELDYQPKLAAKMLRQTRTNYLGLLINESRRIMPESGFSSPIMMEFIDACETVRLGYHIESSVTDSDSFQPPRMVAGGLVDAVAVAGKPSDALTHWLKHQCRIPWVSIDEPADYCVIQAWDRGIERTIRYLHQLGHRKIGYVGSVLPYASHRMAYETFIRVAKDLRCNTGAGRWIKEFKTLTGATTADEALPLAHEFFDGSDRPTAIYCHDFRWTRALCYAAMKKGLRVPEDLSLIGQGITSHAEIGCPAMTGLHYNFRDATRCAVDMLTTLIDGKKITEPMQWVDLDLVVRSSTAPCSSHGR